MRTGALINCDTVCRFACKFRRLSVLPAITTAFVCRYDENGERDRNTSELREADYLVSLLVKVERSESLRFRILRNGRHTGWQVAEWIRLDRIRPDPTGMHRPPERWGALASSRPALAPAPGGGRQVCLFCKRAIASAVAPDDCSIRSWSRTKFRREQVLSTRPIITPTCRTLSA